MSSVATPGTSTTSTAPTDRITLSAAAQAALTGPAAPASASVTDAGQALATLNDTSGKASVTDQLSALSKVSGLVASGAALQPVDILGEGPDLARFARPPLLERLLKGVVQAAHG